MNAKKIETCLQWVLTEVKKTKNQEENSLAENCGDLYLTNGWSQRPVQISVRMN